MSFYGSMYYQVAQSFAKILFKNSGLNNFNFLSNPSNGDLEADSRTGVFSIDSGNRWIQINPNGEGCQIWHSAPATKNLTVVQGMEKTDSQPTSPSHITELQSGDYFKVPLIYYDDAGHIAPSDNQAVYYRMPVIDIVDDISNLENTVKEITEVNTNQQAKIEKNESDITSLKGRTMQLENTLGNFSTVTQQSDATISNILGNVDAFRTLLEDDEVTLTQAHLNLKNTVETSVGSLEGSLQGLLSTLDTLNSYIKTLEDRIEVLENQ